MATLAQLQTTLAAYESARDDILAGRTTSVQVEGQSYTFLSLPEIEKQITAYSNRVAIAQATGNRVGGLGIVGRLGGMGY
jgi:hypothetical protein